MIRRQGRVLLSICAKRYRYLSRWLLTGLALALMLAWNWKLVLTTGAGVGLMLQVYVMQGWNWQRYWLDWQQFLKGSDGKLTVAVGSGGFAALCTYVATTIWAESENRWLATGTILQGLATLLTFGLLCWHIVTYQEQLQESQLDLWVRDLTDSDPLKRLMAVRKLSSLLHQHRLNSTRQEQVIEYFQLMLSREQESTIREALLDSLCQGEIKPLRNFNQPLQIGTKLNSDSDYSAAKQAAKIEYIEN
ncbi:ATP synthase subunit I [Gloeothece verrucosa]|nr:ATP synthase subunit I [Gloeothece verrucosa]